MENLTVFERTHCVLGLTCNLGLILWFRVRVKFAVCATSFSGATEARSVLLLISCIASLRHILAFNFLLSVTETEIIYVIEKEMQK